MRQECEEQTVLKWSLDVSGHFWMADVYALSANRFGFGSEGPVVCEEEPDGVGIGVVLLGPTST